MLCFLACLCAIAALASDRAASGWRRQLGASATVQVRPKAGETASEAAARAAEALAGAKGVTEARALGPRGGGEAAGALARRGQHSKTTCLCRAWSPSISIRAIPPTLRRSTKRSTPPAWTPRWTTTAAGSRMCAAPATLHGGPRSARCLLFALSAGAMIAFATRATLQARRTGRRWKVLHLAGAEDRFVAGLVQRAIRALGRRRGRRSARWLAAALAAFAKLAGGENGLTPVLPLAWIDLLGRPCPCPLLAAGVAAIAVRAHRRCLFCEPGRAAFREAA